MLSTYTSLCEDNVASNTSAQDEKEEINIPIRNAVVAQATFLTKERIINQRMILARKLPA
jgi:hypothetical protein